MLKNLALLVSLCANVFLLASAVLLSDLTAASPPPPAADGRATSAVQRRSLDDAAAYYRALQALGLAEHEAKLLLGARLEERAMAKLAAPADRYWEPRQAQLAQYGATLAAAQATVRAELRSVLGAGAEGAPELARIFRPLDARYGFLSAQEQAALQTWQAGRRREAAPARAALVRPGAGAPPPAAPDSGGDELAQLRHVLPAKAAFEVAVRDSALAEQLRGSGAKLGESEFREAYALLADAAAAHDPDAAMKSRRQLRALLGAARFDRVWAIRDPLAAIVRDVGRERGLDDADVMRAYGVLNANQERLTELAAAGDLKSESALASAQTVARDEQIELERAVGEENARAILNARNSYFVALTRPPPTAAAHSQ